MAVAIRLRREGTKDRPYYKIVVADSRKPRDGRFIEAIGTYDPGKKSDGSSIDVAKAEDWIRKGARPSTTVASILKKAKKVA